MRKADKIAGVSVLIASAAAGAVLGGAVQPGLAIGTVAFVVWLGALWTEFHS
jgi:hypothetical protein